MKRRNLVRIGCAALLIAGGVALAIRHSPFVTRAESSKATYRCPMHPTIVSDRPGECPICHMKLVKEEETRHQTSDIRHQQRPEDVCYLHNCPKMHEGKPCPMTVVAKAGERVTCPICGAHVSNGRTPTTSRKILYWTDPMIPGYTSDKPGKSPMGMDLIPVYEEEAPGGVAAGPSPAGYAPVLVSAQKQQLMGITTAPVERRALVTTIRAAGTVAHDPELYQAQTEFLQAHHALARASASDLPQAVEEAQKLEAASRLRLRHMGLSEALIEDMSSLAEPDQRLLIGGGGEAWVYASIYEYELALVQPGQSVAVTADALPGRTFTGTVKAIDPVVDGMTRTTRVRILAQDPDSLLRPALFVHVTMAADLGDRLAIPREAVMDTGTRRIVFVDKGQGLFEPRDVALGANADGFYEVVRGVAQDERVVTSGNFLMDSESRLKGTLAAATAESDHQHQDGH